LALFQETAQVVLVLKAALEKHQTQQSPARLLGPLQLQVAHHWSSTLEHLPLEVLQELADGLALLVNFGRFGANSLLQDLHVALDYLERVQGVGLAVVSLLEP
jgi:hypothetical protein